MTRCYRSGDICNEDREPVSWWRTLEADELSRLARVAELPGKRLVSARVCFEYDHTTGKTYERVDMVLERRERGTRG